MIDFSKITEQEISEKFEDLPQDLKNVLSSVNTSTTIENIAAKYRLNEEKTTMMIQLVGLVILGFAGFEEMKEEMKETIDISPEFITLIADEVRQKIFSPVINSLQKKVTEKRLPTPTQTPMPQVSAPAAPIPPKPAAPPADKYREPIIGPAPTLKVGAPTSASRSVGEIIDLRKTPPPPMPAPVAAAPIPPIASKPAPPLTFTRPIEPIKKPEPPMPLIEAEPHKVPTSIPTTKPPVVSGVEPQFIIRPPGLPPTDK